MPSSIDDAYVERVSSAGFSQTLDLLATAIERAGMTIFARIDHAAGARDVGMTMPETVVLMFGNPRGGTPAMKAAPRAALDLPLKLLVREADGRTVVAFRRIDHVMREHGVSDDLARPLVAANEVVLGAIGG